MAPKKETQSHTFAINDLVLGRIKGYPAWPAKIVDPEKEYLRSEVLAARKKNTFLIRYYPDATYSWSPGAELKPLSASTIDEYVKRNDKGGKAPLLVAYKTAQDPQNWESLHAENMERARSKPEEEEEESEPEAKTGSKRKSTRKSGGSTAKKPKTEKKETKKSKAEDKKKDDTLEEGLKKCKDWRHKLQRGFLGGPSSPIKAESMPDYDKCFTEMESTSVKPEWLTETKLPKVLRRITGLESIPRDEEFKIKLRAADLIKNWSSLVPEGQAAAEETAAPTDGAQAEPAAEAAPEPAGAAAEEGDLTVLDQSIAIDEKEVPAAEEAAPAEEAKVNGDAAPEAEAAAEAEAAPAEAEAAPAAEA